ncbi:helix-turn-helix domain-containing protein [Streptomyces sp. MUM 203J]|uniref:helix-turn-helix domain-containing protein n=1 Tax=Streptomyces sp. MUM 203J TaxID=2791990 RepID=UPI0027E5973B|nr:helix-turn-helix domain-containing protein [Streptomyces sp. MUM 203J]
MVCTTRTGRESSCSPSWPWPPRWSGRASGRRRWRGWTLRPRKGNHGGRPSVVDDDKLAMARARHAKGESVTAIAKALGVSRATLYRHIGESA